MKGSELTAEILNLLQEIRMRPSMFFWVNEELIYEPLANYLTGYLTAMGQATGKNLYNNITYWHQQQIRKASPMPWHRHIRLMNEEASENELCNLLLADIEIYFKQNPNWQEDADIPLIIWFDDEDA